ncbi:EF-hand domain-containing protein [Luteimonas sp. e5]
MKSNKTLLTLGTLAGSLALSGSALAVQPLASPYMDTPPPAKQAEGMCGFKHIDRDGDGKISREEFAAAHDGKDDEFDAHDLDGDGSITEAEMEAYHAEKNKDGEGKCGAGKCGAGKCGGTP